MTDDIAQNRTPAAPGTFVQDGVPDLVRDPDRPEVPGYELLDEVGRGGMGVVYRARDAGLARDVAVKLLLARFPAGGPAARRFADEARITAQLQHPGVPPVHDLGSLPDGRPFLAMKLIKGRTLADLLAGRGRQRPEASPNLVAVFEGVCQAVGYAHAHGVVHRDLKPANVMVGAFGEVQVMDWGLAKALASRERQRPEGPADVTAPATEVGSTRDEGDETQAGAILGTPAYMPPEQAIGAVDQIDARSDVFALGGILCAILTRHPPYLGADAESTRQLAARGKLDDAKARLAGCGADPDLVDLCERCLSVEKADRPADGGAVARAVADLRAAADERARQAEVDRVRAEGELRTAEVRAAEEWKRRRVQRLLSAAALLVVGVAGVGAVVVQKQRADRDRAEGEAARQELLAGREKELREARAREGVEAALARLPDLYRRGLWDQAAEELVAAGALVGEDGDPGLRDRVAAARRDTALVARLDRIRLGRAVVADTRSDDTRVEARYAAAFREHGLDVLGGDPADLGRRVAASPVREYLLTALEDWRQFVPQGEVRRRMSAVAAGAAGPGWRDRLTDAWDDATRLAAAYDAVPPAERSPALTARVGDQLHRLGADGVRRLEDGLRQHPADFWLHFTLGSVGGRDQAERRVGACRAALALRPGTPAVLSNLGCALADKGDLDGALAALREAVRLDPTTPTPTRTWGPSSGRGRTRTGRRPPPGRRSGSTRRSPCPTTSWASPSPTRGTWTVPWPPSGRRSGSTRRSRPPTATWASPSGPGGTSTGRSRRTGRRSDWIRRSPWPTTASASPSRPRATPTGPSPPSGSPSGPTRSSPRPGTAWASPSKTRGTSTGRLPRTGRRSASTRGTPRPTATSATS
ncbi:MAG: hypothetical protein C0501_19295 [Isosphaera sp.]|nr:hypothetical protein [Isosphaera sp.]